MAARPPSTRVEVGTVRVAPEAAVRPRPAAVVKLAAVIGSRRKIGCEVAMDTRQMATVKAIKPCKYVHLQQKILSGYVHSMYGSKNV